VISLPCAPSQSRQKYIIKRFFIHEQAGGDIWIDKVGVDMKEVRKGRGRENVSRNNNSSRATSREYRRCKNIRSCALGCV